MELSSSGNAVWAELTCRANSSRWEEEPTSAWGQYSSSALTLPTGRYRAFSKSTPGRLTWAMRDSVSDTSGRRRRLRTNRTGRIRAALRMGTGKQLVPRGAQISQGTLRSAAESRQQKKYSLFRRKLIIIRDSF